LDGAFPAGGDCAMHMGVNEVRRLSVAREKSGRRGIPARPWFNVRMAVPAYLALAVFNSVSIQRAGTVPPDQNEVRVVYDGEIIPVQDTDPNQVMQLLN